MTATDSTWDYKNTDYRITEDFEAQRIESRQSDIEMNVLNEDLLDLDPQ